jgi:hypothetical protein
MAEKAVPAPVAAAPRVPAVPAATAGLCWDALGPTGRKVRSSGRRWRVGSDGGNAQLIGNGGNGGLLFGLNGINGDDVAGEGGARVGAA